MPEEYKQKIERLAERRHRLDYERQNLLNKQLTEDEMAVRDNTRTPNVPQVLPTFMQLKINSDLKNRVNNQISETLIEAEKKQKQKEAQERFANMTDEERKAWVQKQWDKTEGLGEADSATDWYHAIEEDPQKRAEWDRNAETVSSIGATIATLPFTAGLGIRGGKHVLNVLLNPMKAKTAVGAATAMTSDVYFGYKGLEQAANTIDKWRNGEFDSEDIPNFALGVMGTVPGISYGVNAYRNATNMFNAANKTRSFPSLAKTVNHAIAKIAEKTAPKYLEKTRVWDPQSGKYIWRSLSDQEIDDILRKYEVSGHTMWNVARQNGFPVEDPHLSLQDDVVRDIERWMGNPDSYRKHRKLYRELDRATTLEEAEAAANKYLAPFYRVDKMEDLPSWSWRPTYPEASPEVRRLVANRLMDADNAMNFTQRALKQRGFSVNPTRYVAGEDLASSYADNLDSEIWLGLKDDATILSDGKSMITMSSAAAHEAGHFDPRFNTRAGELRADSPYYRNDYSGLSEDQRKLFRATTYDNLHDFELAEGASDAYATKANMALSNITTGNSLDLDKKYTYWDLIKYKFTPQGMTDRFIKLRGGWWKGWKQQLDALNSLKNGGKIYE